MNTGVELASWPGFEEPPATGCAASIFPVMSPFSPVPFGSWPYGVDVNPKGEECIADSVFFLRVRLEPGNDADGNERFRPWRERTKSVMFRGTGKVQTLSFLKTTFWVYRHRDVNKGTNNVARTENRFGESCA